jgi:hypothetical protein
MTVRRLIWTFAAIALLVALVAAGWLFYASVGAD